MGESMRTVGWSREAECMTRSRNYRWFPVGGMLRDEAGQTSKGQTEVTMCNAKEFEALEESLKDFEQAIGIIRSGFWNDHSAV